ncbi:MAG: transposase [Pirellulaceae bacterium]
MKPIYTADNTTPAFQLNWSVTLFGRVAFPPSSEWLDQLSAATEPDGVRMLEFRCNQPSVGQFLVSTRPQLSPSQIIRSLKGRWQYLIRTRHPSAFRRNYFIASVGEANCQVLDQYIARQTSKHSMADPRVQERLPSLQFVDPAVDLGKVMTGNYGQFVYGLQVVLENEGGWNEIRDKVLADLREMIIRTAAKKHWRLSRIGLLSDHIHVLLGAMVTESPASIALSLMNNLAYAQGMKPVFRYSYYVGTFGPYDRGAVRRG